MKVPPPVAVEYISSFILSSLHPIHFVKSDGDEFIQYTYAQGTARGPALQGVVLPGATLRTRVHPDGVGDLSLQVTMRASSGEATFISSGGRADFISRGDSLIPIRVQPDVAAEGTKFDSLNRNSMLLVGDINVGNGQLVLHLYRLPVTR